jgi:hypothetical protein
MEILFQARYRVYDSRLARWLSADPLDLGGGLNLYEYVGSNPINRIDPEGLSWVDGWFANILYVYDFADGAGPGNRYYGADDYQTQQLSVSSAMSRVRGRYKQAGCKDGKYSVGTFTALWDTAIGDGVIGNPTAFEVGGFEATFTNLGNGYVRVEVFNPSSLGSLIGESGFHELFGGEDWDWTHRRRQPPSSANAFPQDMFIPQNAFTTINQRFEWIERRACSK